MMGLAEAQKRR